MHQIFVCVFALQWHTLVRWCNPYVWNIPQARFFGDGDGGGGGSIWINKMKEKDKISFLPLSFDHSQLCLHVLCLPGLLVFPLFLNIPWMELFVELWRSRVRLFLSRMSQCQHRWSLCRRRPSSLYLTILRLAILQRARALPLPHPAGLGYS